MGLPQKNLLTNKRGAAALFVVIIISAVVLLMAVESSRLGLGESEIGFTAQKSGETLSAAEGCVEEAMRRLKLDANYSGGTLSLSNGSCIISVLANGSTRTITSTATVGVYTKKVEVILTLNGTTITISSWTELST